MRLIHKEIEVQDFDFRIMDPNFELLVNLCLSLMNYK